MAIVNNRRGDNEAVGIAAVRNEAVVFRQMAAARVAVEDERPTGNRSEDPRPQLSRAVQTVKFVNSDSPKATGLPH